MSCHSTRFSVRRLISAFRPCVTRWEHAIVYLDHQCRVFTLVIRHDFLNYGSFSSPWLFTNLLNTRGITGQCKSLIIFRTCRIFPSLQSNSHTLVHFFIGSPRQRSLDFSCSVSKNWPFSSRNRFRCYHSTRLLVELACLPTSMRSGPKRPLPINE